MADRVRRLALWPLFAALLALSAWGFHSGGLFQQAVWEPAGLGRFLSFAGVYACWFLVVDWLRPGWFLPLTAAVIVLYSSLAVGPVAVAAVLFFAGSALALGKLLFGALDDPWLELLAGISVYVLLIGAAVRFPANYPLVYLALFALPVAVAAAARRLPRVRFASRAPAPLGERIARGAAVFPLLAHWLVTLKPEVGSDGLAMHLVVPFRVAQQHMWAFDFRDLVWALMPMNANWCFTAVFLTGGEFAARLLNFCLLVAAAALLQSAARRWLNAAEAWLVAALFLSTPVTQLVTGSLFAENYWAAMLLGAAAAVWKYRESGGGKTLIAAAVMAGSAAAAKFGALVFVASLACFAAAEARRRRRAKEALFALACLLVFAAPPYLTALVKTGNPVYPFLNAVFRSPHYDDASFVDARFQTPLDWSTLYDATFHTSRFLESQNGALGFHYMILLPVALCLLGRGWPYQARLAGVTAALGLILNFSSQSNLRYAYPALPLLMVALAAALGRLRALDPALHRAVLAASVAALGLNLYFLPASGWYHKEFTLFEIGVHAPVRQIVDYLNRRHPGAAVAFFETNQVAGLRGRSYANNWHSQAFLRRLRGVSSAGDFSQLARELDIRFFVAPTPNSGIDVAEVPVSDFLPRYTESEFRAGRFYVARLREEPLPVSAPLPAPPGSYDDRDLRIAYHGPWVRGRDFPQAAGAGVTYCDAGGASFAFAFSGREVSWLYTATHNRGTAEIFLDGESKGRLDLFSAATRWQAVFKLDGFPAGNHTLLVRVLPARNPFSTGNAVDLDALLVR